MLECEAAMNEAYHSDNATSMGQAWPYFAGTNSLSWTTNTNGSQTLYSATNPAVRRTGCLVTTPTRKDRTDFQFKMDWSIGIKLPNSGWNAIDIGFVTPYGAVRVPFSPGYLGAGLRIECSGGTYHLTSHFGYYSTSMAYTNTIFGTSISYAYSTFESYWRYEFSINILLNEVQGVTSTGKNQWFLGTDEKDSVAAAKDSIYSEFFRLGMYPYVAMMGSGAKYLSIWKVAAQ